MARAGLSSRARLGRCVRAPRRCPADAPPASGAWPAGACVAASCGRRAGEGCGARGATSRPIRPPIYGNKHYVALQGVPLRLSLLPQTRPRTQRRPTSPSYGRERPARPRRIARSRPRRVEERRRTARIDANRLDVGEGGGERGGAGCARRGTLFQGAGPNSPTGAVRAGRTRRAARAGLIKAPRGAQGSGWVAMRRPGGTARREWICALCSEKKSCCVGLMSGPHAVAGASVRGRKGGRGRGRGCGKAVTGRDDGVLSAGRGAPLVRARAGSADTKADAEFAARVRRSVKAAPRFTPRGRTWPRKGA